jgi:hypothetical protein
MGKEGNYLLRLRRNLRGFLIIWPPSGWGWVKYTGGGVGEG